MIEHQVQEDGRTLNDPALLSLYCGFVQVQLNVRERAGYGYGEDLR